MPDLTTSPLLLAATALLAYLLGSVSFGLVMARLFGLGDLRRIGSGNIGATNVLRTGNRTAAFLTLILDAGKGAIAVLAARALLAEDAAQVAAFFSFLGHCFSVFLGFRGGKGVATFFGTALALSVPVGMGAGLIWIAVALLLRYSSLAALVAAAGAILFAAVFLPSGTVLFGLLAALVFWRHRSNIERLLAGTEAKIGR